MDKPLMAKATAVWLVDNTTISFKQIADFCGLHELEVQGIADGEVAQGVKGFDPIASNQLTQDEIDKAEACFRLALETDRENAAYHTNLAGALVGTTKPTIQSIRERTHWNIQSMEPIDPVALGLCKQTELDAAVQKANAKRAAEGAAMSDDERRKLLSTEQSLGMDAEETRMPTAIEGLETFTLGGGIEDKKEKPVDADSFFNLPDSDDDEEDDDN